MELLTGDDSGGRLRVAGGLLVVELGPLVGPIEQVLERSGLDRSLLRGSGEEPQIVLADAGGIESARGRHAIMVLENRRDFTLDRLRSGRIRGSAVLVP